MRKRVISIILSLLLCISCFSSTVMAAEVGIEKSSLNTGAFTCQSGDFLDVVFYINASSNVQGFNGTIKLKTGLTYSTGTTPNYEVNSALTNVTPYINPVNNMLYNFSLLFNPNGGQTFTKKTELIRFHTKATKALTSQTLVYTVEELFDKNYNDIAASNITCSVEKVTSSNTTLTSITVTPPSTTTYYVNGSFSTAGMKVTAKYSDNSTKDVTNSATVTSPDMSTAGTKTVTVSYGGKTATFNITVEAISVTGISVSKNPTKTSYYTNETFSSAGTEVTVTYNNGTTKVITSGMTFSSPDMSTAGTKTVTVTYSGKTATFSITVLAVTVSSLTISKNPTKTSYYTGDKFDSTGLKVTAKYNNNSTADVTSSVTLSNPDMSTAGTKTVTVTYGGKSASFTITVSAPTVSSIAVTTKPTKVTYFTGETFSSAGMKITATYNNNTTREVTSSVSLSSPDMSTAGTKAIKVTYEGKTTSFNITVTQTVVSSLNISTKPNKVSYYTGDTFSSAGLKVTAHYNNNTSRDVSTLVSLSKPDMSTAGTKQIVVTYEGKSVTFDITVTQVAVTSIAVNAPTKTSYFTGEALNTAGMKVTASYNNGATKDVTAQATVSAPDMTTAGTKAVTASFGGQTVTFNITIKEVTAVSLTINKVPNKTEYYVGEELDNTGIDVIAMFSNSTTRNVSLSITCTPPDMTTVGEKNVTVHFGGQSAQYKITVSEIIPTALNISVLPTKVEYYIGESFTTNGIAISASFNNGTRKDVTNSVTYSAPDMTSEGIKEVTVSYNGVTTSFVINVKSATLTEIKVTKMPDKLDYYTGETFSSNGMTVMATYSDGASKDVSSEAVCSQPDMSTAGKKAVEVYFAGQSADIYINVTEAVATGLTITQYPTKLTYFVGDTFDPSGIIVTATFNDGSSRDVTNSVSYSQPDMNVSGTKEIIVTFGDVKASFNIEALDVNVTEIVITKLPDKLEYNVGDEFTYSGIVVTANFSDGTSSDVTSSVTVSQPDMTLSGTRPVTVSYGGKTADYSISITDSMIKTISISVAHEPDKTYFNVGEDFTSEGIIVTAVYSDGSTKDVTDSVTIFQPDMNTAGSYDVLLSYDGLSTTYKVYVIAAELTSITVVQPPEKTEYYLGEDFISDGMKVTATFSDGSTIDVSDSVTYSQPDMSTAGTKQITVTFSDKSTEISINVLEISLTGLTVSSYPEKLSYTTGDIFVKDGLTVTASYSDGSTRDVTEIIIISEPDMTTAGTKQITLTYGDQSTVFEINVTEAVLSSVEVTSYPAKTEYGIGDKLDTTGLVVTVKYDNGATKDITSEAVITEPDMSTLGTKTVSIEYNGLTASFEITVAEVTLVGIQLQGYPTKRDYLTDEVLIYTGLSVVATMSNGNITYITNKAQIINPDMSTPGTKEVIIEYEGMQTSFEITVTERTLQNIQVVPPSKKEYVIGEQLDEFSMSVIAYYSGGKQKDVKDQVQITGFDSTTPGTKTVVVKFGEFESSFTVEVLAVEAISLNVTPPSKTEYQTGDNLDTTGMIVYANYNNNTQKEVTDQVEITGFDSSKAGTVNVTVVYAALSSVFTVTVKEKEKTVMVGDSNGDGRITAKDSLNVLRYSIGLWKNVSADIIAALDVDGNGKVTASDALRIQRYAIGLVKTLI